MIFDRRHRGRYVAVWIDLFAGSDPFEGQDEEAGLAAFGGSIVAAGPGLCALNVKSYVAGMEPSVQDAARRELERTQRPQGIAVLRFRGQPDRLAELLVAVVSDGE